MAINYSKKIERNFLLTIGIIFLMLTIYVIKDIFSLIIYSIILAYFLYPLYLFYKKKVNNERIASIFTLLTSILIFFIPLALLSYFLILSLIKLVVEYREYIENPHILNLAITSFTEKLTNSDFLSTINFAEIVNQLVAFIINLAKDFFSAIPIIILYFFIILFITFYLLIYNIKILYAINEYIPLSLRKQNAIVKNITKNIEVLMRGYFLTALIQTFVALVGYIILGVPNILIVTFLTLIVSLVPYLGTPLVWVPVSIYMIFSGNEFGGIALLIYGTFVISLVDNFVRPILMSDKETIPPSLIFIGFVGGIFAFGIIGIILGPIIISITAILLKYVKEAYENPI